MKWTVLTSVLGVVAMFVAQQSKPAPAPALHVRNTFSFTINAPQSRVAPLFGAHMERLWAEGWDPQFVYPQPPEDRAGAVFTIKRGHGTSTWITTIFEPEKGHIQYAYFIPDSLVTLIDIRLSQPGASSTRVEVAYERTALSPELQDHVRQQGETDAKSGPHWQKEIEDYLARSK